MSNHQLLRRTAGLLGLTIVMVGLVLLVGPRLSPTDTGVYVTGDASGQPLGSLCWFYSATGIHCPMCGMLRSLIALLRGEVGASVTFHPAGPVMAAMMLAAAAAHVWRARGKALRCLQAGTALAILTGVLRWMM